MLIEADTMQISFWHEEEDLFSLACYICALHELHCFSLSEQDPNHPGWGSMDACAHACSCSRASAWHGFNAAAYLTAQAAWPEECLALEGHCHSLLLSCAVCYRLLPSCYHGIVNTSVTAYLYIVIT